MSRVFEGDGRFGINKEIHSKKLKAEIKSRDYLFLTGLGFGSVGNCWLRFREIPKNFFRSWEHVKSKVCFFLSFSFLQLLEIREAGTPFSSFLQEAENPKAIHSLSFLHSFNTPHPCRTQ